MTEFINLQRLGRPLCLPSLRSRFCGAFRATPYYVERGWRRIKKAKYYVGYYRTARGSFRGKIQLSDTGEHEFYVFRPPPQLELHLHYPCFLYRGEEMYCVHFHVVPKSIDDGIIAIEQILYESLGL